MKDGYIEILQPFNLEEQDLVTEIVSGKWRQERFWGIETSLMEIAMLDTKADMEVVFKDIEPLAQTAYALSKQYGTMKAMEMISRFEGRMRRLHQTARRDLERLQTARATAAEKEIKLVKPEKPARTAPPPPVQEEPLGEPRSFRSFISDEELRRLNHGKNEPNFDFELPFEDPNAA
jgi:hypothetical protein